MRSLLVVSLSCLASVAAALADGPADNRPENVRRVPKVGIEVSAVDRKALEDGLSKLEGAIEQVRAKKDAKAASLLPDVQVFHKAVHDALKYQEFFDPKDLAKARHQLEEGQPRAEALLKGEVPLGVADRPGGPGLCLEDRRLGPALRPGRPVDVHDRDPPPLPPRPLVPGAGRDRQRGQLHRRPRAPIRAPSRRPTRSSSTLTAGTATPTNSPARSTSWRRSTTSSGSTRSTRTGSASGGSRWGARRPGSSPFITPTDGSPPTPARGSRRPPRFLKVFQSEAVEPTWYEKALWHLYDCTDYAANILQCPTVAYSGELDSQKQAADVMDEALRSEEVRLVHIIGPATKHAYHPEARKRSSGGSTASPPPAASGSSGASTSSRTRSSTTR